MSIGLLLDEMRRNVERVRAEEGDEAAEAYERRQRAGVIGGHIAGAAGAMTGAAIGSAIFPGIGTVIGGVIGLFAGITHGVKDETTADNVYTALGAGASARRDQ